MARHTHLSGGTGDGSREDCPACQQAHKIAADAAAARGDDPLARVDAIAARIDRLRLQYVTPFADGHKITDDESFHVDVIADILIHAALTTDVETAWSLDSLVDSALEHARTELADYRAARG